MVKAGNYAPVFKYGGIMIALALLSLFFGAISARLAAISSTGFVTGLRSKVFNKIQSFSFQIWTSSRRSLITRLTNDASMIQNAFHISIRIGIRAPVLMIGYNSYNHHKRKALTNIRIRFACVGRNICAAGFYSLPSAKRCLKNTTP